jgi:dTDP-4-dehydrorhamnose reductase
MSTDGVFAGARIEPYREIDHPDCTNHYGRTKALGECPAANALNIRCSIVGRDPVEGKGLLEWLLRQPNAGEALGFQDHLWNGVTTLQFAQLCEAIIENDAFDRIRDIFHVHHFCPNPITTKYELLCAWRDLMGMQVTVRRANSVAPAKGRLLASNFDCLSTVFPPRTCWRQILSELARWSS